MDETPGVRVCWSRPIPQIALVHLTRDRGERVEAFLLLVGRADGNEPEVLKAIREYLGESLADVDIVPVVDVVTGIAPPVAAMMFMTPGEDLGVTTVAIVCAVAFFGFIGGEPDDGMDD